MCIYEYASISSYVYNEHDAGERGKICGMVGTLTAALLRSRNGGRWGGVFALRSRPTLRLRLALLM